MKRAEALRRLNMEQCTTAEIKIIISRSNLGKTDSKIAKLWLIDGLLLADIGAEMGFDRSTIGKRVHNILEKIEKVSQNHCVSSQNKTKNSPLKIAPVVS